MGTDSCYSRHESPREDVLVQIERVPRVAGTLLEPALPDPLPAPLARIVDIRDAVLVLGSRQGPELVDHGAAASAGVDVVRRHSGGGAVLLHPGRALWIDVLLPRHHPLWLDDVSRSFHWLGEVWVDALHDVGVQAKVHRGGLERTLWGPLVCFGALGAGEVTVAGRKVVGMSQRRTRSGARFQCLVHAAWRPAELLQLLSLAPEQRVAAIAALQDRAAGPGVELAQLERAVIERLAQIP